MKTPVRLAIAAIVILAAGAALYPSVAAMMGPKVTPFGVSAHWKPSDFPVATPLIDGATIYTVEPPEPNPALLAYSAMFNSHEQMCGIEGRTSGLSESNGRDVLERLAALLDERYGEHEAGALGEGYVDVRLWDVPGLHDLRLSLSKSFAGDTMSVNLFYVFISPLDCLPELPDPGVGL